MIDNNDYTGDLRKLASAGELATTVANASRLRQRQLAGAAFELCYPIVFRQVTRQVERKRGHRECVLSVHRLAEGCVDGFYDDVEAVVDYLLTRSTKPIVNLEAWVTSGLNAAIVDGYRKRRGERGALQRPRPVNWLAVALDHDQWLLTLAIELLNWVGNTATAGTGMWPLDGWARRRAEITDDWTGSDPAVVGADVERVLAAMRLRPAWYQTYVETPLGRKQPPVLPAVLAGNDSTDLPALPLVEPWEVEDRRLRELAEDAVKAISTGVGEGGDPTATVVSVLGEVFGTGGAGAELDYQPHTSPAYEEHIRGLLADPTALATVVDAVLAIVCAPDTVGASR